jgi:hypothetical protein
VTTQESQLDWTAQQIGGSFGGIPSNSVRIAGLNTPNVNEDVDSSCGDERDFDGSCVLWTGHFLKEI